MSTKISTAIYGSTYELRVAEDPTLLPRVVDRAKELGVRGYITHTHSGQKAGGELEGSLADVEQMIDWLREQKPKELRLTQCQVQLQSKYANFYNI